MRGMRKAKDPLTGMFMIGLMCLCIGVGVRVAAWRGESKLKTWQRATARVESVESVSERSGRHGRRTRCATMVRYATPQGPTVRKVVLNNRPTAPDVGVYYNAADAGAEPVAEAHLLSVTGPSNLRFANAFAAGGVVVLLGCGYALRRRMCSGH